jgi:DNA-binding XRE family transcriptional regulator
MVLKLNMIEKVIEKFYNKKIIDCGGTYDGDYDFFVQFRDKKTNGFGEMKTINLEELAKEILKEKYNKEDEKNFREVNFDIQQIFKDYLKEKKVYKYNEKDYEGMSKLKVQLRNIRKDKGITQEEVAKKLNTNKSNISRMENPNSNYSPTISVMFNYVRVLGAKLYIQTNDISDLIKHEETNKK